MYDKIIQCYAFQWFTGGIAESTHADFFSIFEDGEYYFIPMSIILKAIQGYVNKKNEDSNLSSFLSNNLVPISDREWKNIVRKTENNYIDKKTYNNTREYGDMVTVGAKILTKQGAINFKKSDFKNSVL